MSQTRIVLDTNVLYSGLYSAQGASYQILRAISRGRVRIVLSTTLFFEYEDILKRHQSELRLSDREVDAVLNGLCAISEHQKIWFLWRPCLSDPKDDHVLELALAAGVGRIVTHDVKDFGAAKQLNIKIITPKQLLEAIP